ncbi:uncharacterized protein LOC127120062 isoform X2 [Lathyrus oleraceus]|uniref:uncharacterized protein LOC127120057 isoform X2 n=1 Tax=Pisum sativum TaxID=3888 RepID=UPI0021D0D4CB|nr:uncharacterized protein LOC127120057 isoform X2 [Pisum sativum]XP_050906402.1 uncharacterized protein LOC127120062 isoform X2 [Pisum sativum]
MDKRFVFLLLLFPFPLAKLCKQYHSFQASMDALSVKQASSSVCILYVLAHFGEGVVYHLSLVRFLKDGTNQLAQYSSSIARCTMNITGMSFKCW